MTNFTCLNCGVRFASAEMQKMHFKTDWHQYNLKRRVCNLPPVDQEEFKLRVLQMRNVEQALTDEQNTVFYCNACRKQFGNQRAHDNHLNSKKHKENLVRFQRENSSEEREVTTRTRAPHQRSHRMAEDGESKLSMKRMDADDFILEDDDDDDDDDFENIEEEEVDSDEWEKVAENPLTERDCLFCRHKSEDFVENLKHMSIAHSFFIPDLDYCIDIEGLLYYLGEKIANYFVCLWCNDRGKTFYSLDSVRKHMIDKGHCQMLHEGLALAEYAEYYDYSRTYPDHAEGMDVDEEVVPDLLDGDDCELVLPSGAVIGHRSLLRYYKQRLNPNRSIIPKKSDRKLHNVLSEYRALGYTQTHKQAAARKARDLRLMKRIQAKWQMKLACRDNKLQKHFRQQVSF